MPARAAGPDLGRAPGHATNCRTGRSFRPVDGLGRAPGCAPDQKRPERGSVIDATCPLEQRSNAHICPTFGNEQNLGDSRNRRLTCGNVGAACGNRTHDLRITRAAHIASSRRCQRLCCFPAGSGALNLPRWTPVRVTTRVTTARPTRAGPPSPRPASQLARHDSRPPLRAIRGPAQTPAPWWYPPLDRLDRHPLLDVVLQVVPQQHACGILQRTDLPGRDLGQVPGRGVRRSPRDLLVGSGGEGLHAGVDGLLGVAG
jgi:hypothetical protein